jgi:hypothetical protein
MLTSYTDLILDTLSPSCLVLLLHQLKKHYKALKDIAKYLAAPHHQLGHYLLAPLASLLHVLLPQPDIDPSLPLLPKIDLHQLVGYLDVAHATDLETR